MRPSFSEIIKSLIILPLEKRQIELLKYDLNSVEHDTFQEIFVSLLNVYAPLKEKISQSKSCKFCDKGTSKRYYAKNKT